MEQKQQIVDDFRDKLSHTQTQWIGLQTRVLICVFAFALTWNYNAWSQSTDSLVPMELRKPTFTVTQVEGIGWDPEYNRHDASNIFMIDGKYHVYYTRFKFGNMQNFWKAVYLTEWNTEIWLAVSEDGIHWTEYGNVFPAQEGAWYALGRHAPFIVPYEGKYYMYFTAWSGSDEQERHMGVAVADTPAGPFRALQHAPLLSPTHKPGDFDGWIIDDPCVIRREGKFWMYYKGRPLGSNNSHKDSFIGLAFADHPAGPFIRSEYGALAHGHTGGVWPHREGVALMADNPPPDSFQLRYARDGIHFIDAGMVGQDLRDNGFYCPEALQDVEYGHGITWGLALQRDKNKRHFLVRFDVDVSVETKD
jgi:hypothetical protein